jgi:hypothetical protein
MGWIERRDDTAETPHPPVICRRDPDQHLMVTRPLGCTAPNEGRVHAEVDRPCARHRFNDSVTDTICDTILEEDLKKGVRVSVVFALGSFVSAILALKLAFFVLGLMLRVGILATFWAVMNSLALLLVSVAGSVWGIFRTVYDTDAERDSYERHL